MELSSKVCAVLEHIQPFYMFLAAVKCKWRTCSDKSFERVYKWQLWDKHSSSPKLKRAKEKKRNPHSWWQSWRSWLRKKVEILCFLFHNTSPCFLLLEPSTNTTPFRESMWKAFAGKTKPQWLFKCHHGCTCNKMHHNFFKYVIQQQHTEHCTLEWKCYYTDLLQHVSHENLTYLYIPDIFCFLIWFLSLV